MIQAYEYAAALVHSAIGAGVIADGSHPQDWIDWANGRGFCTDHLCPVKRAELLEREAASIRAELSTDGVAAQIAKQHLGEAEKWRRLARLMRGPAHKQMRSDRDWLATEIADALSALPAGVKPTPLAVLGQLRERVGKGVITEVTTDNAVIWMDGGGSNQKLDIKALGARLRRRNKPKSDVRTTQKRR